MSPLRLAVFISGQGTNLQVLLDQKEKMEKLLVVSSREEAYGVERARAAGVETLILEHPISWEKLHQDLLERDINCIFCAGFMKIIPASFIEPWSGRIYNLHPSLLPRFKGLKAIERAFQERADVGVSVHHVSPEVDGGELVLQQVAVTSSELKSMDLEQVTDRVHAIEHELVDQWLKSQL